MGIKTKLKLKLFAGNVEVAESENVDLWQAAFEAINRGDAKLNIANMNSSIESGGTAEYVRASQDKAIESLSNSLGISTDEFEGACAPSKEPPYIHLDEQYWEVLKAKTPMRGRGAISSVVLSATLLSLWFKQAGLGQPSPAQAGKVERTINLEDRARTRSLKNCSWLQIRKGKIGINPAEMSKAILLAKAYCTKQPLKKAES